MDLVEEQDRAAVVLAEALAGALDDLAHVLDAGVDRATSARTPAGSCRRRRARAWSCRCPADPRRSRCVSRSCSTSRRSGLPGPTRCSWPTTSSIVRGRSRAASGAWRAQALLRGGAEQVAHGRRDPHGVREHLGVGVAAPLEHVVDQPRRVRPTARRRTRARRASARRRRRARRTGTSAAPGPRRLPSRCRARPADVERPLVGDPLRVLGAGDHVGRAEAGLLQQLAPRSLDRLLAVDPAHPAAAASCPASRRARTPAPRREVGMPDDDHHTGPELLCHASDPTVTDPAAWPRRWRGPLSWGNCDDRYRSVDHRRRHRARPRTCQAAAALAGGPRVRSGQAVVRRWTTRCGRRPPG